MHQILTQYMTTNQIAMLAILFVFLFPSCQRTMEGNLQLMGRFLKGRYGELD